VVAQSHRKVEGSLSGEEVCDLHIVETLQRLHHTLLGPLAQQASLDGGDQLESSPLSDAQLFQTALLHFAIFVE